tara:strand:- start:2354 stop:2776 length:423 start_codon:yes stop_codon:yes gene_type:complete
MKQKTVSIPIRLTESQVSNLERLQGKYTSNSAQLTRWAVDAIISIEKITNNLTLPLDFNTIEKEMAAFSTATDGKITPEIGALLELARREYERNRHEYDTLYLANKGQPLNTDYLRGSGAIRKLEAVSPMAAEDKAEYKA